MYYRPRIIPCLTIINRGLVKTKKFNNPRYIGDPINTVKIFNGKGVDELCILDIRATIQNKPPDFEYLKDIASEAFMPLSYGGGITKLSEIEKLFYIGYEKVIINSSFILNPELIKEAVKFVGTQSIVASIDIKTEIFDRKICYINSGKVKIKDNFIELAKRAESLGVGEILLTSITKDGTMEGYDIDLVKKVSESVNIPVIASGGAKDIYDFKKVLEEGKAHAVSATSIFVFYGNQNAVLISTPNEKNLYDLGIYKE